MAGIDLNGEPRIKFALSQHPMWLIIDEDTVCAERTPPWGAPDIDTYAGRLRRNLETLKQCPTARLNFEFSALEIEDVCKRYPDIYEKFKGALQSGQISFVNGTYSQPHLQTLSLESSIREFALGLEVYHRLFGADVRVYQMQEPGYNQQTPQILSAFGYKFAVMGFFINAIEFLDPHELYCETEFYPHYTEPLYNWQGIDGALIPLLIPKGQASEHYRQAGYLRSQPVRVHAPDLGEFNPEHVIEIERLGNYTLLEECLREEIEKFPPKTRVNLWCPWGYVDGTRAEELTRADVACETALAQAETLGAINKILVNRSPEEMSDLWRSWCKCHHHDAYWHGAPELRDKCINLLHQTIITANKIALKHIDGLAESINVKAGGPDGLLFFFVYPRNHRGVLHVHLPDRIPAYLQGVQGRFHVQLVASDSFSELLVPFQSDGAGYSLLTSSKERMSMPAAAPLNKPHSFSNQYFKLTVNPDGSLLELSPAGGDNLFVKDDVSGADLTAAFNGKWNKVGDRIYKANLACGAVADIVESRGSIGPLSVVRRCFLYHDLPWFEMDVEILFDNTTIGDFADDMQKLDMWWPVGKEASVISGIGGGAVPVKPGYQFYAVNWVDMATKRGGLAIANFGTPKYVYVNGRLCNILAWGAETKDFSNRRENGWHKVMDLRISGRHHFHFAVMPHNGSWQDAQVPDWAMSFLRPPVASWVSGGAVFKPGTETALTLDGNGLVPTAISSNKDEVIIRFYESLGRMPVVAARFRDKHVIPKLYDVGKHALKEPRPWMIAEGVVRLVCEGC